MIGGEILKSVWNFIVKNEFWFFCLIIMGLYVGEYQTGEMWMASLAFILFLIAGTRLASRGKEDSSRGGAVRHTRWSN